VLDARHFGNLLLMVGEEAGFITFIKELDTD